MIIFYLISFSLSSSISLGQNHCVRTWTRRLGQLDLKLKCEACTGCGSCLIWMSVGEGWGCLESKTKLHISQQGQSIVAFWVNIPPHLSSLFQMPWHPLPLETLGASINHSHSFPDAPEGRGVAQSPSKRSICWLAAESEKAEGRNWGNTGEKSFSWFRIWQSPFR